MVACPACNRSLNLPDDALGRKFKCPCGATLRAMRGPGGAPVLEEDIAVAAPAPAPRPRTQREAPRRIWKRSARYRAQRSAPAATIVAAVLLFVAGAGFAMLTLGALVLAERFAELGAPGLSLITVLVFAVPAAVFIACGFGCMTGNNVGRIAGTVVSVLVVLWMFQTGVHAFSLIALCFFGIAGACLFMPSSNDYFAGRPQADAPGRRSYRR